MTDTSSLYDLHPVELAAHALLSAPLDHLNDNFGQLHQLQVILHARLRLIEKRLEALQRSLEPADAGGAGAGGSGGAADASSAGTASAASADAAADRDEVKLVLARVRALKRRLAATAKLLRKVVERVDALEAEVDPTT
jgi:hypothetical protein